MVDSCLHCKFCNGAWRPRAAFQDRVLSFEDRIIYIEVKTVSNERLVNKFVLNKKKTFVAPSFFIIFFLMLPNVFYSSNAFDIVSHIRLLTIVLLLTLCLGSMNFLPTTNNEFSLRDVTSDSLVSGLACPSVLFWAQVLFLAFINDLRDHVQSRIRLFADDCLLIYHHITMPCKRQWCRLNGMTPRCHSV